MPGPDPIVASRRRECGARDVEERLDSTKERQTIKESDESSEDASENVYAILPFGSSIKSEYVNYLWRLIRDNYCIHSVS